jgi:ABC-2 type transport system ATP-binding protein
VRILRDRGKTLLISSHILSELGEMCDTMVFMDNGRVMHQGDTASLQRRGAADAIPGTAIFDIAVAGPVAPLLAWLEVRPGWKMLETRREGARAEFAAAEPAAVATELRRLVTDLPVVEFRRHERRLEETFVDMLRQGQVQSQTAAGTRGPPPLPKTSETAP